MPRWVEVEEFPDYAVSDEGEFVNMKTEVHRKPSKNQQGILKVTLYKEGKLVTRSLALMVANAFLPEPDNPLFNTPIHLDGDRTNCRADNLMWRPRWFAVLYHRQFHQEGFYNWNVRIQDTDSGKVYNSLREAAIDNGLYIGHLVEAVENNSFVPITFQSFEYFED